MLKTYITQRRSVLWIDVFDKEPKETKDETVKCCHPRLWVARERLNERYADVKINYYRLREEGFEVRDFLYEVEVREA